LTNGALHLGRGVSGVRMGLSGMPQNDGAALSIGSATARQLNSVSMPSHAGLQGREKVKLGHEGCWLIT